MHAIRATVATVLVLGICSPLLAGELGDKAPALAVKEWVKGKPVDVTGADGKNVYVASNVSNAIAIFSRNTLTGELTSAGFANPAALNGPQSVTVSPDGKSAYVSSASSNELAISELIHALVQSKAFRTK